MVSERLTAADFLSVIPVRAPLSVIPGRAQREAGIHNHRSARFVAASNFGYRGYGFRVRRIAPSRNDKGEAETGLLDNYMYMYNIVYIYRF